MIQRCKKKTIHIYIFSQMRFKSEKIKLIRYFLKTNHQQYCKTQKNHFSISQPNFKFLLFTLFLFQSVFPLRLEILYFLKLPLHRAGDTMSQFFYPIVKNVTYLPQHVSNRGREKIF